MSYTSQQWNDNAVTTYLKRYYDAEREVDAAKHRLERLEYQAAKDARYLNGVIFEAIEDDRRRISERIITSQAVKKEVIEMLELLPIGDERRALELYYISHISVDGIADAMYCGKRTVIRLKERGVKMIIERLGGAKDGRNEKACGKEAANKDGTEAGTGEGG